MQSVFIVSSLLGDVDWFLNYVGRSQALDTFHIDLFVILKAGTVY
ncbi:hypothetical protein [Alteribacter populi]|nr:hypothetical protein [Alteribacter populi]